MRMDLSQEFARFAGREVKATVTPGARFVSRGVSLQNLDSITIDEKDPTVVELAKAARKAGFYLQIHAIGYQYDQHLRRDLLNAYIEKGEDGTFRLSPKFIAAPAPAF